MAQRDGTDVADTRNRLRPAIIAILITLLLNRAMNVMDIRNIITDVKVILSR